MQVLDAHKALSVVNNLADRTARLHTLANESTIGLFSVHASFVANNSTPKSFEKDAIKSSSSYMQLISDQIDASVSELIRLVNFDTFDQLVSESSVYIKESISRRLEDNIHQAKMDLLRYVVTINQERARGRTGISASVAAKQSLRFVHVDRMGRKKNVISYVNALLKMQLIGAIFDSAFISEDSKGAAFITLSDGSYVNIASYFAGERGKYVHPNAKALPIQGVKS